MMNKRLLLVVLGAGVLAVAAFVGVQQFGLVPTPNGISGERPVTVGYSIAKTGYLAVATSVQQQAYELWAEQVNQSGGLIVGGQGKRPIKFVSYDDQSEPSKAAEIYERLISVDKVDLLLAPYATSIHIAIAPVIERHKFPLVGSTASSTLLR